MAENIVSVTSKGTITIPSKIRDSQGIEPNSHFIMSTKGKIIILTPVENKEEWYNSRKMKVIRKQGAKDVSQGKVTKHKNAKEAVKHLSSLIDEN